MSWVAMKVVLIHVCRRFYPAHSGRNIWEDMTAMGLYWPKHEEVREAARRAARGWRQKPVELAGPELPERTYPWMQGKK